MKKVDVDREKNDGKGKDISMGVGKERDGKICVGEGGEIKKGEDYTSLVPMCIRLRFKNDLLYINNYISAS